MNGLQIKPNNLKADGMADVQWVAYFFAMASAGIDIYKRANRYATQIIGSVKASAGTHAADGMLDGVPYGAALDISVKGMSLSQIATVIDELCRAGFVAWYRNWPGNLHIHCIYCGLPMKPMLDRQCADFFQGKSGLVSHKREADEFWYPEPAMWKIPKSLFEKSNPRTGEGVVVPTPLLTPKTTEQKSNALYLPNRTKETLWMPVFDDVSYAPVRAFGDALGLDVEYIPATRSIVFAKDDKPIAIKMIASVGHAPIRQLVAEVGLGIDEEKTRANPGRVFIVRPAEKVQL